MFVMFLVTIISLILSLTFDHYQNKYNFLTYLVDPLYYITIGLFVVFVILLVIFFIKKAKE